jgi:hypothetical protein
MIQYVLFVVKIKPGENYYHIFGSPGRRCNRLYAAKMAAGSRILT